MPSHIYIYVCDVFVRYMYFCVVSHSEGLAEVNYGAFVDLCGGGWYFMHGKFLQYFCYCPVGHKYPRPPAHRQTSTFARHRAQAVMSTARERKNARFFCTPQRAGIQRVTSVSREIPENFSKISSPKMWCVCQKSVPLHSQIRHEAYNTSQI